MGPNILYLVVMIVVGMVLTPMFFAAFVYFLGYVEQYNTCVWFFVAGLISSAGLHLNLLLFRKKIDEWYDVDALEQLKVFALVVSGASLVATGYYLTKAIRSDKGITDVESYYGSTVSAGLSLILGCWLFYLCRWDKRYVELCTRPEGSNRNGGWRPFE